MYSFISISFLRLMYRYIHFKYRLKKTPLPLGCGVLLIFFLLVYVIKAAPLIVGIMIRTRARSRPKFAFN